MMDYSPSSGEKSKEYEVKRKSVTKDGVTKDLVITHVENGYIVCVTTSYMKDGEYCVTKKKWISEKDPIKSDNKPKTEDPKSIVEAIKSINF